MAKGNPKKLELTWIGKGEEPKLEPRILIENPEYSYGDPDSGNMLIHGDNLLALKALEQDFAGQVKCIYIDPPYNTGNAFEHYDDGIEHSEWLNLITPRLKLLRDLLAHDGSIWISIDDDESHYLKVLCDEIFGRKNFVNNVIWEKKYTVANDARYFSDTHDHILVYAKNKDCWVVNRLPRTDSMNLAYKNPDNHPKGPWKATPLHAKSGSDSGEKFSFKFKNGVTWSPPEGTYPRFSKDRLKELDENDEIYFGKSGNSIPSRKTFLSELKTDGLVARTLWRYDEVGHNHEAKSEVKAFNNNDPFGTPKPERLVERIITLSSNEGDIVLDSFLGSGTTAAVAHKMGRKWIGVELGDHAITHCVPRLKKVVDGEQGGISKAVEWKGGGGFKFYTLAPSLLNQDAFGNWVISKEYNAPMLAAAMAKQEGFNYQPSESVYWKQGQSTERDFIFTTTQFLTVQMLDSIHDQMKEDESLLIACTAFHKECKGRHSNISLKKIPHMLLGRCEFGKDDYSMNIVNVPQSPEQDSMDLQDGQDDGLEQDFNDLEDGQDYLGEENDEGRQQTLF
ncbi:MAG: site-specific DNA-methyltransferase [Flavobacteriales bacterium]|nr:site-specific DNA-methyltransferase [Flavobacteriales bacterium]